MTSKSVYTVAAVGSGALLAGPGALLGGVAGAVFLGAWVHSLMVGMRFPHRFFAASTK